MILTANRNVNVRVGGPSTAKFSSRFLKIGETIDAHARRWGERIEGRSDWLVAAGNEMVTTVAFEDVAAINELSFEDVPDLINKYKLYLMWEFSRGEGVKVGVIDNGVAQHPSLKVKVEELNPNPPVAATENNHGTTMACIIAANDPERKKVGVAPNVEALYSYTIPKDRITETILLEALSKMQKEKVNIINMSFASNEPIFSANTTLALSIQRIIIEMVNDGCILVAASGNKYGRNKMFFPAAYKNVISVTGHLSDGRPNPVSNFWENVSVALPSDERFFSDNQAALSSQTSAAAAQLSGILACTYKALPFPKTSAISSLLKKLQVINIKYKETNIETPIFNATTIYQLLKQLL